MDAIRCIDCGDVRWSLIGFKGHAGTCALCGGEMVPERRRPATLPAMPGSGDRRDLDVSRETAGAGARPGA